MSYGIMVCDACAREVHQDGGLDPETKRHRWRHCDDKTPACGKVRYAGDGEPKGKFCGADDL